MINGESEGGSFDEVICSVCQSLSFPRILRNHCFRINGEFSQTVTYRRRVAGLNDEETMFICMFVCR